MAVSIPTKPVYLKALSPAQIKRVQSALNGFVKSTGLKGYAPLIVDGKIGRHTQRQIVVSKYLLGYKGKRTTEVDRALMRRLDHPNNPLYSTPARVLRGRSRRKAHNAAWTRDHQNRPLHGTAVFDGITVAAFFVPILKWCRAHGWQGHVVSGYRTPEYSEHLCFQMCGAPACPGRCAGKSTNHAWTEPPRGAVDVSDYVNFRRVVANCPVQPRIFNDLPIDPVHFSPSGH